MRRIPGRPEVDVAADVVGHLHRGGWTVYQEVTCHRMRQRVDIVAERGGLIAIIEVKVHQSMQLLTIGVGSRPFAHGVFVATGDYGHEMATLCPPLGLGYLVARCKGEVKEHVAPRWEKGGSIWALRAALKPEQISGEYGQAGNARGEYWSPFRDTCTRFAKVVRERPGMTIREAVVALGDHHYGCDTTAVSALRSWIGRDFVPGVRLDKTARPWRLQPVEEKV